MTENSKFKVIITRITGQPAWAGEATSETGDKAEFALKTVGRIGITPMETEGTIYKNGKVEISSAITAITVTEKKHPQPLKM